MSSPETPNYSRLADLIQKLDVSPEEGAYFRKTLDVMRANGMPNAILARMNHSGLKTLTERGFSPIAILELPSGTGHTVIVGEFTKVDFGSGPRNAIGLRDFNATSPYWVPLEDFNELFVSQAFIDVPFIDNNIFKQIYP